MTDKLSRAQADDLADMIDFITKYNAFGKTVGEVKEELDLNDEEYEELFALSMPAIRHRNSAIYWKMAYGKLLAATSKLLSMIDNSKMTKKQIIDGLRSVTEADYVKESKKGGVAA